MNNRRTQEYFAYPIFIVKEPSMLLEIIIEAEKYSNFIHEVSHIAQKYNVGLIFGNSTLKSTNISILMFLKGKDKNDLNKVEEFIKKLDGVKEVKRGYKLHTLWAPSSSYPVDGNYNPLLILDDSELENIIVALSERYGEQVALLTIRIIMDSLGESVARAMLNEVLQHTPYTIKEVIELLDIALNTKNFGKILDYKIEKDYLEIISDPPRFKNIRFYNAVQNYVVNYIESFLRTILGKTVSVKLMKTKPGEKPLFIYVVKY